MSSETSTANRSAMSKPPSASAFHQAREVRHPAALAGIVVRDVQQLLEGKSDAVFHVLSDLRLEIDHYPYVNTIDSEWRQKLPSM